jgi:transposase
MHRHALTDEQWERLHQVLPRQRSGPKATRGDRLFVDAVIYRAKTGISWRDLPDRFGPWKSVYNRFSNWARRDVWAKVFKALQVRVDKSGYIVDGSVIRAHQDASGGKGGSNETLWVVLEMASPQYRRLRVADRRRALERSSVGSLPLPA